MQIRTVGPTTGANVLTAAKTKVQDVYSKDVAFIASTRQGQYPTVFYDTVQGVVGDPRQIRAVVRQLRAACPVDSPKRHEIILAAFRANQLAKTGQHRPPANPVSATRTLWTPFQIGAPQSVWFVSNRTQHFVVDGQQLYFETISHDGRVIPWVIEGGAFVAERVQLMQQFSQVVMAAFMTMDAPFLAFEANMLDSDYLVPVDQSRPGIAEDRQQLRHDLIGAILAEWFSDTLTPRQLGELLAELEGVTKK